MLLNVPTINPRPSINIIKFKFFTIDVKALAKFSFGMVDVKEGGVSGFSRIKKKIGIEHANTTQLSTKIKNETSDFSIGSVRLRTKLGKIMLIKPERETDIVSTVVEIERYN